MTNFLHLHIPARELYGNRRAASLLFVNLSPTGLHESQTACATLPAAKQKGRLFQAALVTSSASKSLVDYGLKTIDAKVPANSAVPIP